MTAAADCIRQCLLKYILSTIPFLLAKNPDDGSSQTIAADTKLRDKGAPQGVQRQPRTGRAPPQEAEP
ncbi:hypothetical protein HKD37_11G032381 [Glycine soja]